MHEVLYRLLSDRGMRESFQGGVLSAWRTELRRLLARFEREHVPPKWTGTGFDLTNEGTTFSLAATTGTIWFKLESASDMAGRAVRLYIDDGTYATKDYTNPQSSGHMLLSSFRITDIGTFTVKGYLVAQAGPDIGQEASVAQATVSMQQ